MTAFERYAIYVVPQGDLGAAGAAWLGWDVNAGAEAPQVEDCRLDLPKLTETPRAYGFHGTVMAPFQIRDGASQEQLQTAFAQLCRHVSPVRCGVLEVVSLGRFVALIAQNGAADLIGMAAQVVQGLDIWRRPLPAAEIERRDRPGLSEAQRGYLRRWGYPYVMDAYRFHMTLTGRIPKADTKVAVQVAADYFMPQLPAQMNIEDLALVGQRADGRFVVIARYPLQG